MTRLSARPLTWIFADSATVATVTLVVIHQSLIASSTYFLAQTINVYLEEQDFEPYLVLYLLSMILPLIPAGLSLLATRRWINAIHRKFILAMTSAAYGNLADYPSTERRSAFEAAVSNTALNAIASYVRLSHDLFSLTLNSVLSIAVIGFILPPEIALGYLISLVISIGMVYVLSQELQNRSIDAAQHYADYNKTLQKTWDNAVLGNAYNYRLWRSQYDAQGATYYRASQRLAAYKQLGHLAIALASLVPTAFLVYQLLVVERIESALIAATIVNLTRIFHILNSLSGLIYEFIEWACASARLQSLTAFLLPRAAELPASPAGAITLDGVSIDDYRTAHRQLVGLPSGRLTIRGAHGADKSTLLLSIKQAFAEQAYLLPADSTRLCWRSGYGTLSAGQRLQAVIDEILQQHPEIRYLLLDQWDVDLDADDRIRIDQLLESLGRERVVIEARSQEFDPP